MPNFKNFCYKYLFWNILENVRKSFEKYYSIQKCMQIYEFSRILVCFVS